MSVFGTRPFWRIHSPVRMCHPVSPSQSSHWAPFMRTNRKIRGIRNATSVSDGRKRIQAGANGCRFVCIFRL